MSPPHSVWHGNTTISWQCSTSTAGDTKEIILTQPTWGNPSTLWEKMEFGQKSHITGLPVHLLFPKPQQSSLATATHCHTHTPPLPHLLPNDWHYQHFCSEWSRSEWPRSSSSLFCFVLRSMKNSHNLLHCQADFTLSQDRTSMSFKGHGSRSSLCQGTFQC